MTTKFNIGDKVWVHINGRLTRTSIRGIEITSTGIRYLIDQFTRLSEDLIFPTRAKAREHSLQAKETYLKHMYNNYKAQLRFQKREVQIHQKEIARLTKKIEQYEVTHA